MEKPNPKMNRDVAAAYLSVVPGLGHLFKHHIGHGLLYLLVLTPALGFATGLLAFATFGVALLLVPAVWIGWAAYEAYHLEDWSHHQKPAESH